MAKQLLYYIYLQQQVIEHEMNRYSYIQAAYRAAADSKHLSVFPAVPSRLPVHPDALNIMRSIRDELKIYY